MLREELKLIGYDRHATSPARLRTTASERDASLPASRASRYAWSAWYATLPFARHAAGDATGYACWDAAEHGPAISTRNAAAGDATRDEHAAWDGWCTARREIVSSLPVGGQTLRVCRGAFAGEESMMCRGRMEI